MSYISVYLMNSLLHAGSLWSLGGVLTTLILAVSAMLFKEQGVTVLVSSMYFVGPLQNLYATSLYRVYAWYMMYSST